jgi:hypothetical protein
VATTAAAAAPSAGSGRIVAYIIAGGLLGVVAWNSS